MYVFTGWFFLYRDNGYGPYDTWDEALEFFRDKHGHDPNRIVYPVYGTAHIRNAKLVKFERKLMKKEDIRYSMDSIDKRQDFLDLIEKNINKYAMKYTKQNQRDIIERSDMELAIKAVVKDISDIL